MKIAVSDVALAVAVAACCSTTMPPYISLNSMATYELALNIDGHLS